MLIANGIKDIENRTWKTSFRGRIYIHSSQRSVQGNIKAMFTDEQFWSMSPKQQLPLFQFWQNSSIIGEVDIIDCVLNHPSVWAEHFTDKELKDGTIKTVPVYNWVLANPVLYKEPILNVKGKLSFWEFDGKENNTPNLK